MAHMVQTRHGWLAPACRCNPHGLVHPQCCFGMREQGVMHKRCCGGAVVDPAAPPLQGQESEQLGTSSRCSSFVSPFEARRHAGQLPVADITGTVPSTR